MTTDDERLTQIQARDAKPIRSEAGTTMTQAQADVGFLLRQLAEARGLANLMYGILYAMPTSIGDHDERLDWDNKPGWLDGERSREAGQLRDQRTQARPGADPPCGQVSPGLGRTLGPCVRETGHPEDVSHVDRFGALWWPKR